MAARLSTVRVIALIAAVANIAWSFGSEYLAFGEGSMITISQAHPNLFTPAGYAFAIWGLIYTSFIVYAILALLPSQRGRPIHDELAPLLIAANVLTGVWVVIFRMGWIAMSVVVIVATLLVAVAMYRRALEGSYRGTLSTRWWTVPFGLFLGWLSVATIADTAIFLVSIGWQGAPWSEAAVTIAMLIVAGAVGLTLAAKEHEAVVPAVIAWGTGAIAWEQRALYPDVALAATIVAVLMVASAAGSSLGRVLGRVLPRVNRTR